MANKSFVVKYLIQARDNFSVAAGKMSKGAGKMAKGFDKMARSAIKARRSIKKSTGGINSDLKNMVKNAIGVFTIREFFSVGIKFQNAIADLSAITGASGKDLEFLREESLRLGRAAVTSQDQVATAFKIIASAKSELLKDPKGLSIVAEQVLLLANTGLELEEAALVTTQALNQFAASADQAARFVNVLAAGSKVGASEVRETGVAIIKSGAVARLAGLSFEELNAAIQVLAKGGIKAEVAGTGLKTMLIQLEKSGVKKIMPSVVGFTKALSNLGEANLSITKMTKLFGTEALVVGQILSENAGLVGEWTKAITDTNVAQEQANVRLKTFSKRMAKVRVIISESVIRAFNRLAPTIEKNATAFADFLSGIKPEQVNAFVDSIKLLIDAAVILGKSFKFVLDTLVNIGRVAGETAAAISTLDVSQFSEETKATVRSTPIGKLLSVFPTGLLSAFLTSRGNEEPSIDGAGLAATGNEFFNQKSQVDVGVQIGLDPGLQQTSKPTVGGAGVRRADVGMVAG